MRYFFFILAWLAAALVATLLIEVGLSRVFLKQKQDRKLVFLVQFLTNPLANFLFLLNEEFGDFESPVLFAVLELIAILVEACIYKFGLQVRPAHPLLLSLVLNLASCCVGILLTLFIFS